MKDTFPVALKKVEELIASIKTWCNNTFSLNTHNHDAKYDSKGSASTVQTNLNTHVNNFNNHINALGSLRNMVEWIPHATNNTLNFTTTSNKTITINYNLPENEENDYVRLRYVFIIKSKWWDTTNSKLHTYYRICGLSRILLNSDGNAINALNAVKEDTRNTQLKIDGNGCVSKIVEYNGFKVVLYNSRGYDNDNTALLEDPDDDTLALMENFPIYEEYYPFCHFLDTEGENDITEDIVYACISQVVFAHRIIGRNHQFLGLPDYSNNQSQGAIASYTASSKGWVYVYYATPSSGSNTQFVTVYINGNPVYAFGTAHQNNHGALLPIGSGDVVTGINANGAAITFSEIIFYPMK